jgi:hypothetical protein
MKQDIKLIIFSPFEKEVACFLREENSFLKALALMFSKNMNLFYKYNRVKTQLGELFGLSHL